MLPGVVGYILYNMENKEESKLTQWHPAFCAAIELTFLEDADKLEFDRENVLNTKPITIDLVVIKKIRNAVLNNNIGKIFREFNILEYKSPNDVLSMNTLFKTMAYACLYKAYETSAIRIPPGSITVTLIRMRKPVKMLKELKEYGWTIEKPYSGIYYIEGDTFQIPVQIIVTKELDESSCLWLKALQNDITEDTAKKLLRSWSSTGSEYETELIESVMQVSVKENAEAYDIVNREGNAMYDALFEVFKPSIDKIVNQSVEQAVNQAVNQTNTAYTENLARWLKSQDPSLSDEEALQSAKTILS